MSKSAKERTVPASPRVLMPTFRRFRRAAYHGQLNEAQDVFCQIDNVELLELEPYSSHWISERVLRSLVSRKVSRQLVGMNTGLHSVRVMRDYDLFVLVCQGWWDILSVNAVKGWKDHCKTSVCYIDEVWASSISRFEYLLRALEAFDHVVIGLRGSVDSLSTAMGRRCHWVPLAVDCLRFTPLPEALRRSVDIYSIGRRQPGVHDALRSMAASRGMFYMHDTFSGADTLVPDYREHRTMLANIAKRSRFFIVSPAKLSGLDATGGQVEVGTRYFEGSSAGAVMIGQTPHCEAFEPMFGWQDSVIDINPDGSDVEGVLDSLMRDPSRLEAISQRNAREALLRHDWVYRWRQIVDIAKMTPTPALAVREQQLSELAQAGGAEIYERGSFVPRAPAR